MRLIVPSGAAQDQKPRWNNITIAAATKRTKSNPTMCRCSAT